MKKKIGLIVNPVAGMGGSVGLKGTDGELYKKALTLGAQPVSPIRIKDVFAHLAHPDRIELYSAPGNMGSDYLAGFPGPHIIVGEAAEKTTPADTKKIARMMVERNVELLVPDVKPYLQGGKECSNNTVSVRETKQKISAYILETLQPHSLYLLGPGTTLKSIADAMDIPKTLLGVDAYADGKLVGSDVNEETILTLAEGYQDVYIIVTPIGGNGFIFGRGSKQFTPEVIARAGREHIILVASADKLFSLNALRVDTGDFDLDSRLTGYLDVIIGYRDIVKMEVRC